jgi:hypothetical protein
MRGGSRALHAALAAAGQRRGAGGAVRVAPPPLHLDLDFGLLCDVPIGAHFNTSHDKAHCVLSCVGAGLRRY